MQESVPVETSASDGASPPKVATAEHGAWGRLSAALLASAPLFVPWLMSRSTVPAPYHPRVFLWYKSLRQPAFKPPDAAVPVAWSLIEASMATAAYRLLRSASSQARNRSLAWLATNTVAIGAWSWLFFGKRDLPASTVAAAAMIASGTAYVVEARKVDRTAAAAGVPFVAWVAFATVLTAAIWQRNRGK